MTNTMKHDETADIEVREDSTLSDTELETVSGGAKPWEREPTPGSSDIANFTVTTRRVK